MKRLHYLTLFLILVTFLFYSNNIFAQEENLNDFNASEHIFFGQDFVNTFFAFGFFICAIIFFIPFVFGLLIAFWIYKDANKRGKEGIIWAIIFVILSLLSFFGLGLIIILLIVWLATRPPIGGIKPKKVHPDRRCPNCGRVIPWEAKKYRRRLTAWCGLRAEGT